MKTYYTQIIMTGTAAGTYKFIDESALLNKKIYKVQVLSTSQMTTAPDGSTIMSDVDSKKLYFTFKRDNSDVMSKVPFALLNPILNAGISIDFGGQTFQWNQCIVVVPTTVTASTIPMLVYYED